jgi:hypothetical protein
VNAVAKANILAAQLIAHNLEGNSMPVIKEALAQSDALTKAASAMYRQCLVIASEKGCQEEFYAAQAMLSILYAHVGWDAKGMLLSMEQAINAMYEVEA